MKKNKNKELLDSTKLAIKYGHGYSIDGTTTWIEYNGAQYKIKIISFYDPSTSIKNELLRNIYGFVLNKSYTFTRINRRLENGNEQQADFNGVQDKILSMMLWKYIQKHPRR